MSQAERPNGAFGKSDIEGKAARVAASELGSERVSKERERISQSAVADDVSCRTEPYTTTVQPRGETHVRAFTRSNASSVPDSTL